MSIEATSASNLDTQNRRNQASAFAITPKTSTQQVPKVTDNAHRVLSFNGTTSQSRSSSIAPMTKQ